MGSSLSTVVVVGLEHRRQPASGPSARSGAVLWPEAGKQVFDAGRLPVRGPLGQVVAYYWWVVWRHARPRPFRQQVLTNPVTHLTVEAAEGGVLHGRPVPAALVHGLVTEVFTVDLPVAGRVGGLAFHPGGLAALLDVSVGELSNTVVDAGPLFGPGVDHLLTQVLMADDDERRREVFVALVGAHLEREWERVRSDAGYRTVREAVAL